MGIVNQFRSVSKLKNQRIQMQKLNGDWLIEIMSQPEHSNEVLDLLDLCELDRIDMGKSYTIDFRVKKYNIELNFSCSKDSVKQRAEEEEGNFYFQGVCFYENCTTPLPFELKIGDDKRTCAQKTHAHAKIVYLFRTSTEKAQIDSYLLEDADKKYFFKLEFTLEEHRLESIFAFTWNIDMDLNRNYMKKKISIEEALNG